MNIRKLSETKPMENAHGIDARNLYSKDTAMVTVITLEPGQSLRKHITPVDAAFYVLEGTGIVEVGDEKLEVGKDTLIDSPKGIPHCWYNESGGTLKFMIIKAPKQTTETIYL